jgi:hypothetical protein
METYLAVKYVTEEEFGRMVPANGLKLMVAFNSTLPTVTALNAKQLISSTTLNAVSVTLMDVTNASLVKE